MGNCIPTRRHKKLREKRNWGCMPSNATERDRSMLSIRSEEDVVLEF